MLIIETDPNVYKGNDYTIRFRLEMPDPESGEDVPATGLTDLFVRIAAVAGGPAINAALQAAAPELIEREGTYMVSIPGAAVTTHMFGGTSYDGKDVFIEVSNTGQNVTGSTRVKAYAVRRV